MSDNETMMDYASAAVSDNSNTEATPSVFLKTETAPVATPNVAAPVMPTRPDYWKEELWDGERGAPKLEAASKLLQEKDKAIEGFRKAIADREAASKPQVPEKYTFETAPEFEGLPSDDKAVLGIFSELSRKNGFSDDQAMNFLNEYQEKISNLHAENSKRQMESFGPQGVQLMESIDTWTQTRQTRGTFSAAESNALKQAIKGDMNLATAIAKTIGQTGERLIPAGVRAETMQATQQDIKNAMVNVLGDKTLKPAERNLKMQQLRAKLHTL